MVTLFLDIETLPPEDRDTWLADFSDLVSTKRGESEEDARERCYRDTSFDGTFGRTFCIGYAKEPPSDAPLEVLSGEEREMLREFWELARDVELFVADNVFHFDLRFLYQRSVICGVEPTKFLSFQRYRSQPIFDTLREWTKWDTRQFVKLDVLARALGLPSPKEQMSGAEVYDYWLDGRHEEIKEYCKGDVEVLRQVYRRMTFT